MIRPDKEVIFKDILTTLARVGEDWEYSDEISLETTLLQDLGLESIDVVVLGEFLEDHYGQTFPFTEYYTDLAQKNKSDIRIKDLVDLIFDHFKN